MKFTISYLFIGIAATAVTARPLDGRDVLIHDYLSESIKRDLRERNFHVPPAV